MGSYFSFVARNQDKIALVTIAIIIIYCVYACIIFYRARCHRYGALGHVALDRTEECEKGCVETVALLSKEVVRENNEGYIQNAGAVQAINTEKDEEDIQIQAPRPKQLEIVQEHIKFMELNSDEIQSFMDAVLSDPTLLEAFEGRGNAVSEEHVVREKIESKYKSTCDEAEPMAYGQKKKRSTWTEELEGVDFGSMGTKGIRMVRGDVEISIGDEEGGRS
jgi:hypothetical protein